MLLRDFTGRSVEFHLFSSSGVDFAEDWLDAGRLPRDTDGVYLVRSIDYIIDYVTESLSARRAWIEMALIRYLINTYHRSLSARRAWIEIFV